MDFKHLSLRHVKELIHWLVALQKKKVSIDKTLKRNLHIYKQRPEWRGEAIMRKS